MLTCIASDPDGDVVRYSWSASEGSITGVGNKVTWIAPNKGGSFNITVIVSDGKGGETRGNVMVTVASSDEYSDYLACCSGDRHRRFRW